MASLERWSAGAVANTGPDDVNLTNHSLHWVDNSTEVVPDQVITGSATYLLVGNTDPTDNLGNVGFLGSASFSADFTNSTVDSSLQLGINNQVWTASGSGAINKNLFSGHITHSLRVVAVLQGRLMVSLAALTEARYLKVRV